jgi:hypothetical protein
MTGREYPSDREEPSVDRSKYDCDQEPAQPMGRAGNRTAVRGPVDTVIIALVALAVAALVWLAVRALRPRSASRDTPKQTTTPESASWRQRANELHRRCLEVIRDLEPDVVSADGSPDSRDMRASWLRRAGASAAGISPSAAGLGAEAVTDHGRAAAEAVATRMAGLGSAAADLAETMDDAALTKRLASEHRKAEDSLRALEQMM